MALTLNRRSFEKLIKEDKEWLLKQPRDLERDHIEMILNQITDLLYKKNGSTKKFKSDRDKMTFIKQNLFLICEDLC